jgi:putative membrane protein
MRLFVLALMAALTVPAVAFAQNDMSNANGSPAKMKSHPGTADKKFIKNAVTSGLAEVQDGQLAEHKGDAAVQAIGAKMVADHSQANAQLNAILAGKGLAAPTSVTSKQAETTTELQELSGDAFDTAYLKGQKQAHEHAIKLFETEATDGTDPDLKSFAQATLPTLQMHLQMIKSAMK